MNCTKNADFPIKKLINLHDLWQNQPFQALTGRVSKGPRTPKNQLLTFQQYLTLLLDIEIKLFAGICQSSTIKVKQLNDGTQDQTFAQKVNGYLGLDYIYTERPSTLI